MKETHMTTTLTDQAVPTGTWTLDKTHSQVGYAVRHGGVSLFRGGLTAFDAVLDDGHLRGAANVASITVEDERLAGHLLTPSASRRSRSPRPRSAATATS
jgi:polyisoprenoid-binding protein YceI